MAVTLFWCPCVNDESSLVNVMAWWISNKYSHCFEGPSSESIQLGWMDRCWCCYHSHHHYHHVHHQLRCSITQPWLTGCHQDNTMASSKLGCLSITTRCRHQSSTIHHTIPQNQKPFSPSSIDIIIHDIHYFIEVTYYCTWTIFVRNCLHLSKFDVNLYEKKS